MSVWALGGGGNNAFSYAYVQQVDDTLVSPEALAPEFPSGFDAQILEKDNLGHPGEHVWPTLLSLHLSEWGSKSKTKDELRRVTVGLSAIET